MNENYRKRLMGIPLHGQSSLSLSDRFVRPRNYDSMTAFAVATAKRNVDKSENSLSASEWDEKTVQERLNRAKEQASRQAYDSALKQHFLSHGCAGALPNSMFSRLESNKSTILNENESHLFYWKTRFEEQKDVTSAQFIGKHSVARANLTEPYAELDTGDLSDDFYQNVLDWSCKDLIACCVQKAVFLKNGKEIRSRTIHKLTEYDCDATAVSFSADGFKVAVGNKVGELELFDVEKRTRTASLGGNVSLRLGNMRQLNTIHYGDNLLACGGFGKVVNIYDVRIKSSLQNNLIFQGVHGDKVCGLKWQNPFDERLLASGGNDNKVSIWTPQKAGRNENANSNATETTYSTMARTAHIDSHTAATKAIAWKPGSSEPILATGGGTRDRNICIWNLSNPAEPRLLRRVDSGSQVCNLIWSMNGKEILSTHGHSVNALIVWDAETLECKRVIHKHTDRVLFACACPSKDHVLTATYQHLCAWTPFEDVQKPTEDDLEFGTNLALASQVR